MTLPVLLPAEREKFTPTPDQLRIAELIAAIPWIGHNSPPRQKPEKPAPVIHSDEKQYHRYRRLATPAWLTEEERAQMRAMYLATRGTRGTKRPLSVDHIVPLRGKNVCGLHVPWNLRIVPLLHNIRKNNLHR